MQSTALMTEDDNLTRAMLRHALEGQGYQVFGASNGKDCLQQHERQRPDIILLAHIMPVIDGYACCEALRQKPDAAQMPIVMLSGQDNQASVYQAFDRGVTN
jgi:PleD family two-component response regulator